MRKTPSKMHMHDMATIDTIVFEVINFLEYPGSDRVKPVYSFVFNITLLNRLQQPYRHTVDGRPISYLVQAYICE